MNTSRCSWTCDRQDNPNIFKGVIVKLKRFESIWALYPHQNDIGKFIIQWIERKDVCARSSTDGDGASLEVIGRQLRDTNPKSRSYNYIYDIEYVWETVDAYFLDKLMPL